MFVFSGRNLRRAIETGEKLRRARHNGNLGEEQAVAGRTGAIDRDFAAKRA